MTMSWQNNKKITGLWAHGPSLRWVWIYVQDLGWRLLWNDSDSAMVSMATLAIWAKSKDRFVNVYEEDNKIKEIYAW